MSRVVRCVFEKTRRSTRFQTWRLRHRIAVIQLLSLVDIVDWRLQKRFQLSTQLTSDQQGWSLPNITHHLRPSVSTSSSPTNPSKKPAIHQPFSPNQSNKHQPTKDQPAMTNTMPGTYDLTLYPNLMRYRDPQPATIPPPPNGIPRHPIESLPGDEWRRYPLCGRTKLCVVPRAVCDLWEEG
jgi:hypothetical protein